LEFWIFEDGGILTEGLLWLLFYFFANMRDGEKTSKISQGHGWNCTSQYHGLEARQSTQREAVRIVFMSKLKRYQNEKHIKRLPGSTRQLSTSSSQHKPIKS
jgi:hypothetical protein